MPMHCAQDGGSSGTRYYTACIQKSAFQATLWWNERIGNRETYKIEIILAMVLRHRGFIPPDDTCPLELN